jgi:pantothenate kinase
LVIRFIMVNTARRRGPSSVVHSKNGNARHSSFHQFCAALLAFITFSSNPTHLLPPTSFVEGFSSIAFRRMDPPPHHRQPPRRQSPATLENVIEQHESPAPMHGGVLDLDDVIDLLPIPPPTELIASTPTTSETFSHLTLTWEQEVCDRLKAMYDDRAASLAEKIPPPAPLMCAVVGIPGSGKTTSAAVLADMLAMSFATSSKAGGASTECQTLMMPFDGYHIPMSQLVAMGADAVYRRGAPDTFDSQRLADTLHEIRFGTAPTLIIPGFDHARGDPEDGAHTFDRHQHKIVIVEGLYLLHDQDGWQDIKQYFDVSIYVDANIDVCMDRLKARNKCIPGYTPEEIEVRVDAVDRVNAMTVQHSKVHADIVVKSAAC